MELGGAPPSKKKWGGFGVLPCGDAVGCVCGGGHVGTGPPWPPRVTRGGGGVDFGVGAWFLGVHLHAWEGSEGLVCIIWGGAGAGLHEGGGPRGAALYSPEPGCPSPTAPARSEGSGAEGAEGRGAEKRGFEG